MSRAKKLRLIEHRPPISVFKPAGVPARSIAWVTLTLDEYEALRLADYHGLDQATVADNLEVSRPTVSRILSAARHKVAKAFVEGNALVIEGGPVRFAPMRGRGPGRGRRGWGWRRGT